MSKSLYLALAFALFVLPAAYAQGVVHAVEGTVKKVDAATKTIVVKTSDGAEHTFHFTDRTAVHGTDAAVKGAKDVFHGVKEGTDVVVHYTDKGAGQTADEVDRVGKDGLKVSQGTVKSIDRGAKTLTIKTTRGTEETYRLTDHAARDAGTDIGTDASKTERVTVYYTEQGGHKVAHFFKRVF